jgi:hypothetical protein
MLISIADPAGWRPRPNMQFKERHDFEFLEMKKMILHLDEADAL